MSVPLLPTENSVPREYQKWYSPNLQRDMELLVFGHAGKPVLFFPTRTARFYDYEDWGVINALAPEIAAGQLQVICLDSADKDSFYNKDLHPSERMKRHVLFEKYILREVIPFVRQRNQHPYMVSAGCSLGAYHAANIAFRHPQLFKKVVGMSGRYDVTISLPHFQDLLEGYMDELVFWHQPTQYLKDLHKNEQMHRIIKKMEIIIAVGEQDAFLENNLLLDKILTEQGVEHIFQLWKGEAHKAQYWSKMVRMYFL
jgi:esterase/lipase superfamily enzyme